MRVSKVLCMPQLVKRMKDYQWASKRKPVVNVLDIEEKLVKEGVEVVNANAYVRELDKDLYPVDYRTLPDVAPRFPMLPKDDRSNPNWHDQPAYVFDSQSFPMEGVKQAQVFTKSVQIEEGLPKGLLEKCNFTKLKDAEGLAERVVRQGFIWDATLEKLPNLKNFDYPTRTFRTQIGIPVKRSNEIVSRGFVRLVEQDNVETSFSRMVAHEEELRVNLMRHGYPVQLKLSPLMCVMSKTPLLPFVPKEKVVEVANDVTVPSIFPFLSTVNFDDQNLFEDGDYFDINSDSAFPHVHTAIFSHHIAGSHTHLHPRWNDDRFAGTSILYAFALGLLMARRRFGENVSGILPEPVTTQIVHTTGQDYQFAVFQLNTLDLDENSSSTVKNIVWLTNKIKLFTNLDNKLGAEIFEGYNSEPFNIFRGMYSTATQTK